MKKKKDKTQEVVKIPKKLKKDYINNKEFTEEILACKARGELSNKASEFFMKLSRRTADCMVYKNPLDKEDCIMSALHDCCKYWKNFDIKITDNAFSFFSSICFKGLAKEYNKMYKNKIETISLDYEDDSEIYTI